MSFLNLFNKADKIAEYKLSNNLGELQVQESLYSEISKEHLYLITFYKFFDVAFFLADTVNGRRALINLMKSLLEDENFDWIKQAELPPIDNFSIRVFKKDDRLYLNTQRAPLGMNDDKEVIIAFSYFIIYIYLKVRNNQRTQEFLKEALSSFGNVPLSAVDTLNYLNPISSKYVCMVGANILLPNK